MKETLWEPMRFLEWIHRLRDYDIEDSIKELYTTDEIWEPYENTETFEDSLNSSRISINMTPVKKHLNESLQQLSLDTSVYENTCTNQTFHSCKEQETINTCLVQMELATKTLRKLCDGNDEVQLVIESLNNMQTIINNLREVLEARNLNNDTTEIINSTRNCSITEEFDNVLSENCNTKSIMPTKSTASDKIVQKSVRFTDKSKQDLT